MIRVNFKGVVILRACKIHENTVDRLTTQENPQTIFRNNLNLCNNRKHDSFVCYIKSSFLFIIYISSLKLEKNTILGFRIVRRKYIGIFFEKISTQDYLGLQSDEFLIIVDFSLKSKKSSITSLQYFSITLPTVVLGIVAKIK